MTKPNICSDQDCVEIAKTRGLCRKHYQRAKGRGELPENWIGKYPQKIARVCQFADCGKTFHVWPYRVADGEAKYCSQKCAYAGTRSGEWRTCESPSCDERFYVYPHQLRDGVKRFCTQSCWDDVRVGASSPCWRGGDIGASAAHGRCRRLWGSASQYPCVQCDKYAREWAYDGTDPTQKYGPSKDSYIYYSPWPEFYMPLCFKCHKKKDMGASAAELREYRWFKQIFGNLVVDMLNAYCDMTEESA